MAEDWAADVKKYVPDADDSIITGIVNYCGIALRKRDSSLVSFSDSKETDRVRENFLKKKLALTDPDDVLDKSIAAIGERMKADRTKNRVTVYYLLAESYGALELFRKKGSTKKAAGGAATDAVAGAADVAADAVTGAAGTAMGAAGAAAAGVTGAAGAAMGALTGDGKEDKGGGLGWLWWLLGLLLLGFLLWWLFLRAPTPVDEGADAAAATEAAATTNAAAAGSTAAPVAAGALAGAPAEGSVTIPEGAGVTSELRDGKPVIKVYFASGTAEVVPAFGEAATGLKEWLAANPGSSLAVSGFADPTGNAAANEALSRARAQAVRTTLVESGIAEASVELVKPEQPTDAASNLAGARRVEVVVR
jgi:outer membrane protein OmpA-like peptidoglycan-associated protein